LKKRLFNWLKCNGNEAFDDGFLFFDPNIIDDGKCHFYLKEYQGGCSVGASEDGFVKETKIKEVYKFCSVGVFIYFYRINVKIIIKTFIL
jgi:hypothetical protein